MYLIVVRTLAVIACCNLVITAGYMLWALQRIFLGAERPTTAGLADVTGQEISVLTPLTVMLFLLGIFPAFFIFALTNNTVAAIFKLF